jgi:hypothetical protein
MDKKMDRMDDKIDRIDNKIDNRADELEASIMNSNKYIDQSFRRISELQY